MEAQENELTRMELMQKVTRAFEDLAIRAGQPGSYLWVVVSKGGNTIGGCSANLKPYQPGIENEVEKAIAR